MTLMDKVSWQTGDQFVIASTGDRHSQRENELLKITGELNTRYHIGITWLSHGYHMSITWVSRECYGCHIGMFMIRLSLRTDTDKERMNCLK